MARKRSLVVVVVAVIVFAVAFLRAEQATNQTPALRVTTRLVMLDVVATDKDGKPVTDLKQDDFTIEDSGKKQKISIFGLEQPGGPAKTPALPQYVYSNRPEYNMPSGALTVVVVDGLNSSFIEQARVRQVLLQFVAKQLTPGQQIAVYALGLHLYRLQDFTSDPALLMAAISGIQPKVPPNSPSTIAPLPVSEAGVATVRGYTPGQLQNVVNAFEAEQAVPNVDIRIHETLLAMRQLARIMGGHSGRKNLVWLTAGLPFSMIPDQNSITYAQTRAGTEHQAPVPHEISEASFSNQLQQLTTEDVRRTAALLADNQVAIYPVDARGLSVSDLSSSQFSMDEMSQQTGGKTFKNRNDIEHCVAQASADGSTYYSVGYYPEKKKFDGSFHKFKVSVNRPGIQLRYRPGYYALDLSKVNQKERESELMTSLRDDTGPATMVVFDARIAPPPPAEKAVLPIQFLVKPETITADDAKDGGKAINVDFFVAAFSKEGKPAGNNGTTASATISADQYAQLQQKGLGMSVPITLAPGEYDLHLAVRDNHTGYLGTLTVPVTLKKPGA